MSATQLVRLTDLTGDEVHRWRELRSADPSRDSPYFDPAFAAAVQATGGEVVVALDRRGPRLTWLWALQRHGAVLRPVGWPGADFQGPVRAPGATHDPGALLVAGTVVVEFDHLLDPDPTFEQWVEGRAESPHIDVSGGLEAYRVRASKSGRDNLGQARRKAARAAREVGTLTFRARSTDADSLAWLVRRKREQYAATGARDHFAVPGRRELLDRLLATDEPGCAGMLSTLHAGGSLVAAHFGIRSERVLHWWFPVYDPAFAGYSPGWIMLRELAAAAPGLGLERIDLGRGDDEYKRRARTGAVEVCSGAVTRSPARRLWRRARHQAVVTAKQSSMGPAMSRARRALRPARPIP